jgi:hypothetical protein
MIGVQEFLRHSRNNFPFKHSIGYQISAPKNLYKLIPNKSFVQITLAELFCQRFRKSCFIQFGHFELGIIKNQPTQLILG